MIHMIRLMIIVAMEMIDLIEFILIVKVTKNKIHVQINHYGI